MGTPVRWRQVGIGSAGVLVTATVAAAVAGPVAGLAFGVCLAIIWTLSSPLYAFAAGHLGLIAITPSPALLVAFEIGLFLLLCSEAIETSRPGLVIGACGVSVSGLWAILRVAPATQASTWVVAAVLLLTVGLIAYGIDRYERVRFDLLGQ